MRLFISTTLLIMAGNFVIFVVKPLFEPDRNSRHEIINAAYRNAPDAALLKMANSYKSCAKSELHDESGAAEFRAILAKRVLSLNADPQNKAAVTAASDKSVQSLLGRLGNADRARLIKYAEDLTKAGVADCVISSFV